MIQLTIEEALTLYFVLILALISIPWILYLFRKKKKTTPFVTIVHQCEYCRSTFMEKALVKVPRCPTCGSLK